MRWYIFLVSALSLASTIHARPAQQKRKSFGSFLDGVVHGALDGMTRSYLYDMKEHDIARLDDHMLNFGSYANWTEEGWLLRVHGNVHKRPPFRDGVVDLTAKIMLLGESPEKLTPAAAKMVRTAAADLLVSPQRGKFPSFNLSAAAPQSQSGDPNGSNNIVDPYSMQPIQLQEATTREGDFDEWVKLKTIGFAAGHTTKSLQKVNLVSQNTVGGNATSYLVPATGITIVSDIDDILRVTKIWKPKEEVLNTFARPYVPWMNMPDIYNGWEEEIPGVHFHYFSISPEYATRPYVEFLYDHYPQGSYDTRPLNFSDWKQTTHPREFFLTKIFETFPERKFLLVGDSSNPDVMKAYPKMATMFPSQVQCIFIRNIAATDPSILISPDLSPFKPVDRQKVMIFNTPDDLRGLDIAGGQCINATVTQPKLERPSWKKTFREHLTSIGCLGSEYC